MLEVANGLSKIMQLAKYLSNFKGLAVPLFRAVPRVSVVADKYQIKEDCSSKLNECTEN